MNKQKWVIMFMALALMAGTAGALVHLKTNQHLGEPGIKATPIAGSLCMNIYLPEHASYYESKEMELDPSLKIYMPQDTSFAQRLYYAPDGFCTLVNVVLMGTDRTSIHKPEFCLPSQGWRLDDPKPVEATVPMRRPYAYDLPVMKLLSTREGVENGRTVTRRGIYVYWFVADHELTARHSTRMWHMGRELLAKGVLQRWAYVSCFANCAPGQEEVTYKRMQEFIRAAVPEFQLAAGPTNSTATAPQTVSR